MNNYIEVIEYKNINESFSNSDIYNFINKYIHQFISRPSKQKEKYGIVKRLYLACGKILRNAHNFYRKMDLKR